MLTAEQRIEAYEYAIRQVLAGSQKGMCIWVRDSISKGGEAHMLYMDAFKLFDELKLFDQQHLDWFKDETDEDIESYRLTILCLCIEMTKDELAAQPFNKLKK